MLPAFIVALSAFQVLADQFHVLLRRADAGFGLFLEGVKNIDSSGESNRMNAAANALDPFCHGNFHSSLSVLLQKLFSKSRWHFISRSKVSGLPEAVLACASLSER